MLVACIAVAGEPNVIFYEISGDSAKSLRKQLDEKRPQRGPGERFDGLTENSFSYTYQYAPTKNGCKFTEFSSVLETTIIVPRWVDGDLTSKLGRKWQAYYQALYDHELGHREIGLNFYKELEEVGRNFETTKNCDSIAEEFELISTSLFEKYRQIDRQYDLQTDHGRKLGAIFP
jgi:predicted secreted Zn-dependent protease